MRAFNFSSIPKTFFGEGCLHRVFDILEQEPSQKLLLMTGGSSFIGSAYYGDLMEGLGKARIKVAEARVAHEPSPGLVDEITSLGRSEGIDRVLAIGGGSVLDAGKAVSAMILAEGSVTDYLEDMGTKKHSGNKIPFIAVPTTSGTGSEATKNAVLSKVGEDGYKKSLRHDRFVPDYALLDPRLSLNCPERVTAASGMDALNQLIEGYMSVKGSPLTEALALEGMENIFSALERLCLEEPGNVELRGRMAYGAYLSGIVLANTGLGYVHGFAGVIGGMLDIPHGVVCGKLNAALFEEVVRRVMEKPQSEAFHKIMKLSSRVFPHDSGTGSKVFALIERLYSMEEKLPLPPFSSYGADKALLKKAALLTPGKECPVSIDSETLIRIVESKI